MTPFNKKFVVVNKHDNTQLLVPILFDNIEEATKYCTTGITKYFEDIFGVIALDEYIDAKVSDAFRGSY